MIPSPPVLTIPVLFHTKLLFHLICIIILLIYQKNTTLFPLHRKFRLRQKGVGVVDSGTSFQKAGFLKWCRPEQGKKGLNTVLHILQHIHTTSLEQMLYMHREDEIFPLWPILWTQFKTFQKALQPLTITTNSLLKLRYVPLSPTVRFCLTSGFGCFEFSPSVHQVLSLPSLYCHNLCTGGRNNDSR